MKFETLSIPIKNLKRNTGQISGVPKNPRVIRDNNFRKLKDSIVQDPEMLELREIIAYKQGDDFIIIGGNMRFEALKALNYEVAKCKVITGDTTAEQLKRIILKDNSAYGEWDFDELANEWEESLLTACAIEIPTMEEPKAEEEAEEDNFNPDDIEQEPTVKKGEIWQLGNHRLFCGDCTDKESVLTFMQGRHADLVLTDPPYNVNYSEKTRSMEKAKKMEKGTRNDQHNTIANDKMSDAMFLIFLQKFYNVSTEVCKSGGAFYVWHAEVNTHIFHTAAPKSLIWRDTLIWKKQHFCLTRKDYQTKYEPCLYFTKEGRAHYFCPQRNLANVIELADNFELEKATKDEMKDLLGKILALPTTVIDYDRPMANKEHPTMKPVKLFGMLIKNSSRVGEIVFDPFGGSGTTIVAAEQLNRTAYAIEIEPHYCDVIIARWEKLTGRQAVKLCNINEPQTATQKN